MIKGLLLFALSVSVTSVSSADECRLSERFKAAFTLCVKSIQTVEDRKTVLTEPYVVDLDGSEYPVKSTKQFLSAFCEAFELNPLSKKSKLVIVKGGGVAKFWKKDRGMNVTSAATASNFYIGTAASKFTCH